MKRALGAAGGRERVRVVERERTLAISRSSHAGAAVG